MSEYWKTCIEEALSEIGICAAEHQIKELVEWVEGTHENFSLATGQECIPNPLATENKELKSQLKKEIDKVFCDECKGRGRIIENFANRSSNSPCWVCHGEGKL